MLSECFQAWPRDMTENHRIEYKRELTDKGRALLNKLDQGK